MTEKKEKQIGKFFVLNKEIVIYRNNIKG